MTVQHDLTLDDYMGGKAVVVITHESDQRFPVLLAAALHVADEAERAKLRKVFPKLVDDFVARRDSTVAGLLPGEQIPGVGVMGEDGRIKLPCSCDRDTVRETQTHGDNCVLTETKEGPTK